MVMISTVVDNGCLLTTCTRLRNGSSFETDTQVDNNGNGEDGLGDGIESQMFGPGVNELY